MLVLPVAVRFVGVLTVTLTILSPDTVYVWLADALDVVTPAPSPNVHV